MKKIITIDVEETLCRLDSWLAIVEDCYKDEVKKSMENFKKEYSLKNK